ncbi:MAG: STAS domain-containing protein [Methanobacterium sp.]
MNIISERTANALIITPKGRLDVFGASKLDEALKTLIKKDDIHVIIEMGDVQYLSSGGIRVMLRTFQMLVERGGELHLTNINEYPLEVLEMAGFDQIFSIHPNKEKAIEVIDPKKAEIQNLEWKDMPQYIENDIKLTVFENSKEKITLEVVGDISKVLYASLEEDDIFQRFFSSTEYSIGLGALGGSFEDYITILGEMITIGGTMVWLPTDGNDTPDFLTPKKDTGKVTIHTGFNAALEGDFNEIIILESDKGHGFTISELYAALFKNARQRINNFSGVVSIAMQADISEFYSSGVKISPIDKFRPQNHGMIMEEENMEEWMDVNNVPEYNGETMISFGVGMDLSGDISALEKSALNALFYLHPANLGDKEMLLHNHAVVFKHVPFEKTSDLDQRIRNIVNEGEFVDMRHLLDNTKIKRAIAGVSYISDIIFEK